MNKTVNTIFFTIGLLVFSYLIFNFGIDEIIINIQKTGWWFIPVICVWGIAYIINAYAQYLILNSKGNVSFPEILKLTISSFALDYITPFLNLGGQPYRILSLKDSIGIHNSTSSVILYVMLHFLSSFFIWIIAIILSLLLLPLSSELKSVLWILLLISIFLVSFFYSRHRKGIFGTILNFLSHIKFLNKFYKKLEPKKESLLIIDEQIKDLYINRKTTFYKVLSLEILARIICSFEFLFIMEALGLEGNILSAFYIYAGTALIMNLFFFLPLGLGAREGGLYFLFQSLKFTQGVGIFASVVNRIREFFWILIGLLLLQLTKNKKTKMIENVN
ncbi:MAG: lysylphosphatidylglycerol synthase transmembrane domain-containing protein [Ignavibacterium sp.]